VEAARTAKAAVDGEKALRLAPGGHRNFHCTQPQHISAIDRQGAAAAHLEHFLEILILAPIHALLDDGGGGRVEEGCL
jgi:hypothetical protein